MYPGDGASHLPELTQMEEMLISPVNALVQTLKGLAFHTHFDRARLKKPKETHSMLMLKKDTE
jgi:hypothetical protein